LRHRSVSLLAPSLLTAAVFKAAADASGRVRLLLPAFTAAPTPMVGATKVAERRAVGERSALALPPDAATAEAAEAAEAEAAEEAEEEA
jgi:hypothetical protein